MNSVTLDSSRETVKKGREIILARGQHALELPDAKVFNYLLLRSYNRLTDRTIHEIPVSDALKILKHTSVARLEETLKRLGNVKIEFEYHKDGEDHSVACHFLSYDICQTENGVLKFAFDPILLKFLWEPAVYARINMQFFQQFKTTYGAKLYEILTLYFRRTYRTWSVSVEDLRVALGVRDDQYKRFDNLRRAVIDRAVDEVNALAPFGVELELVRGGLGGKVIELRFSVVPRSDLAAVPSDRVSSGKRQIRDPQTVDIFDGRTDFERGTNLTVTNETLENARLILIEGGVQDFSVEEYLERWLQQSSGIVITDPDVNFISWVHASVEVRKDEVMAGVDEDLFASLLEDL